MPDIYGVDNIIAELEDKQKWIEYGEYILWTIRRNKIPWTSPVEFAEFKQFSHRCPCGAWPRVMEDRERGFVVQCDNCETTYVK